LSGGVNLTIQKFCGGSIFDKYSGHLLRGKRGDLTFAQIANAIQKMQKWLVNEQLEKGSRVVIALNNDVATVMLVIGFMRLGIPVTTFDPAATIDEAREMFEVIQPALLVAADETVATWESGGIPVSDGTVLSEDKALSFLDGGLMEPEVPTGSANPQIDPEDTCLIVYTSGTTGRPKGVVLSYRAVFSQSLSMAHHVNVDRSSIILNLFQFYQIGAIVNGILLAYLQGATLFRPYLKFSLDKTVDLLDRAASGRVTHFVAVPTLLNVLQSDRDRFAKVFRADHFHCFVSTADLLPEATWATAEKLSGKPVVNTYGLTEANTVTFTGRDLSDGRIGTIGRPNNCRIKLVDNGNEVAAGDSGEIAIFGETNMTGYFNDPERTTQCLRDGWFFTGDFGRWTEDGDIIYEGRRDDVIVCGGQTIFPGEITNALMKSDRLADAYAFGVPHDHFGEMVACCVVPECSEVSERELVTFLRDRLSPYKIPRRFYFVDAIPQSERGKVRRRDVITMISTQKGISS